MTRTTPFSAASHKLAYAQAFTTGTSRRTRAYRGSGRLGRMVRRAIRQGHAAAR